MTTQITDVITSICVNIARNVKTSDGFAPYVRDLDDTPITLNQAECPQIFFLPTVDKRSRITFDDASKGTHQSRKNFTIKGYYIDDAENLEQVWISRPRTVLWCDQFVDAVDATDNLNIQNLYVEASAEVRDGLDFNRVPYRGGVITLTGYYTT